MSEPLQKLAKNALNLEVSENESQHLEAYAAQLIDWNQRINLTSITEPDEVRIKHLLDALSVLTLPDLPEKARVIDVGTGGGVPGLPLKIMRREWEMVLLEATGKKVDVLEVISTALDLKNTSAVKMRAEEAGQHPAHREKYDLVLARAVARLPVLLEYLLPLCKVGGRCIAMKGETAQNEADDSAYALQELGGELRGIHPIQLPGIEQTHFLVDIQKVKKSPRDYPRRVGLPSKQPLE